MGNVISALTGQDKATKALQAQLGQQRDLATSQQGQQLALLSKQQAVTDDEAAQLQKPGIGRALLHFTQRGGGAQTLGG